MEKSQNNVFIQKEGSVLDTINNNTVLKNTYFLLSLTLLFSGLTAYVGIKMGATPINPLAMLGLFYGLLFAITATAKRKLGIVLVFVLTGFMGYSIAPALNFYLNTGSSNIILMALIGTGLSFLLSSGYVLTTKKDMSFLTKTMLALFVVLIVGMIGQFFIKMPAFHLALSLLFIAFSFMGLMLTTSSIIHKSENNYVLATVNIYVSLFNIFVSLLNLGKSISND